MARPGESVAQPSPVSHWKSEVTEQCLPPDCMTDGCDRDKSGQNQSLLALTSALPPLSIAAAFHHFWPLQ